MIRLARKLLDGFVTAAKRGVGNDPRIDDFATVIDTCLDAAEAALAPEYDPPTVLVDTREQRPFAPFLWQKGKREYLPLQRFMLAEGDYSAMGLEPWIRIERKSIADLYGSLFGTSCDALGESAPNQERLRKEFCRLRYYPRAYFLIEGMPRDLYQYIVSTNRRVDPAAAIQLVESMGLDYGPEEEPCPETGKRIYGVKLEWRRDREAAEWFVGYVLSRAHTQAADPAEAKKAVKRGLSLPWAYDISKAVKAAADAIREGLTP